MWLVKQQRPLGLEGLYSTLSDTIQSPACCLGALGGFGSEGKAGTHICLAFLKSHSAAGVLFATVTGCKPPSLPLRSGLTSRSVDIVPICRVELKPGKSAQT